MTSILYDELYPRLNFLIGIRANYNEFYNSWWTDKCLNYKGDKLSDYYDVFFSRFVTFNSLYNTIIYTKESLGILRKKTDKKQRIIERGDKEKAITEMSKELSDVQLDILFIKPEIIESVVNLIEIIESNRFVITHKAGQQFRDGDLLILAKLKHTDKKKRYLGILELLYNVRCNMFHGSKGYEHDQIELLKPINVLIYYIVQSLYYSFKTMTDTIIAQTDVEIKKNENKNKGC